MKEWRADWTNDPNDDYNLILEILYDDEDVAVIKQGKQGLILKWYASQKALTLPVDWFLGLLKDAQKGMSSPIVSQDGSLDT